jgi:hypothetical protein
MEASAPTIFQAREHRAYQVGGSKTCAAMAVPMTLKHEYPLLLLPSGNVHQALL